MDDFFFGNTDAQLEQMDALRQYYTGDPFDILPNISVENAPVAPHTLVGLKGAGKTATRRMLEDRIKGRVLNIDSNHPDFELDAKNFTSRSGRTKNIIKLYLLQFLLEDIKRQNKNGKAKKMTENILSKGRAILSKIPNAVDINFGPVSIDIEKLLVTGAKGYVSATWRLYKEELSKMLNGSYVTIFVDDVEDIFIDAETNPRFIESLLRAITDINVECAGALRVYAFLKNGVWKSLSRHPDELDKVEPYVRFLKWEHEDLPAVIAERIQVLHPDAGAAEQDVEALWSREFDWSGTDFGSFSREICQYSANGPRDVIALCNLAKREAGKGKITQDHLKRVLTKFSDGKVAGLHSEYGHIYGGIREFVETVFSKGMKKMTGEGLGKLIEQNAKIEERNVQRLTEFKWIGDSEKEKLVEILYETGVVGIRREGKAVYFIEEPDLPRVSLLEGPIEVHAAYRPALGLQ